VERGIEEKVLEREEVEDKRLDLVDLRSQDMVWLMNWEWERESVFVIGKWKKNEWSENDEPTTREWFEKLTGFDIWGRVEAKLEMNNNDMFVNKK
jgi:hypothetical protein